MDARLLSPGYRTLPPEVLERMAEPMARAAPMNDPSAYQVQPGPMGALARPAPAAMPMGPPPAAALAQPAKKPSGDPSWTPERRAMADELNTLGKAYQSNVAKRRSQRKAISQYDKLHSKLETSAGTLHDLRELKKNYPETYGAANPGGLAHQRQIIQHFENAERLKKELREKARELNKQYQIPIDEKGFLKDVEQFEEAGNKQFDDEAIETVGTAYGRRPID